MSEGENQTNPRCKGPSAWDVGIAHLQTVGGAADSRTSRQRQIERTVLSRETAKQSGKSSVDIAPSSIKPGTLNQTMTAKSDWLLRFSARFRVLVSAPPSARMKVAHEAYERMSEIGPERAAAICAGDVSIPNPARPIRDTGS